MYRWIEHTGELEVELEGASEAELFHAAVAAMRELLGSDANCPASGPRGGPISGRFAGGAPGAAVAERRVALEAADRASLLADWLGELAFLAESEGLVPQRLASLQLGEGELHAVLEARHGEPPHLVKAATYHRLALERDGGRVRARVVLDV